MENRFILLLVCICAVTYAQKCDLNGSKDVVDFPDIESEGIESYMMGVEYTLPNADQTDFYTEYYDILNKRGRVDSQQDGKSLQYLYVAESWESWQINADGCNLINITDTPRMFKDDQSEWLHVSNGGENMRTVGPSAMFKEALSVWKGSKRDTKMGYMGMADNPIRGLNARYWRRCADDGSFIEYYFSTEKEENAFGLDILKTVPLRVIFGGERKNEDRKLSDQVYDIMSFRPYIPKDLRPFDLPKGRGCRRGPLVDAPDLPSFDNKNLMFSSEVIYRKIDRSGRDVQYWSYYSNLKLALDQTTQHLAYHYTPWVSRKKGEDPDVNAPEYVVYDMKHHYAYKTLLETGECQIIREKNFYPQYVLPEDGGAVTLTDPSILYPNAEVQYISEGINRGLKVNVFEYVAKDYLLDKKDGGKISIPKAVITHSYLKDNEVERNVVSVKNALTQVQLIMYGRDPSVIETLTFNFFGFSTEIANRRAIFNIKRCFRNDDDYVWATIGFNVDQNMLPKIQNDVPAIQKNILNSITLKSELNAVRIPIILVDITDKLYVSLMILGKPPVLLDYLDAEENKVIVEAAETGGIEEVTSCATYCLEQTEDCWGFSICGATCAYGSVLAAKEADKQGCKLYRRFDNKTFIPSKELMVQNLRSDVQNQQVKLSLLGDDDTLVQVEASSIEISEPGEDDRIFNRLGKTLDPRMRVFKTGYKLKGIGTPVTGMGRLQYEECQKLCLDFKTCETASYCLKDFSCVFTDKYSDDIKDDETVPDNMCNLITRNYADHFERTPGVVLSITAQEDRSEDTAEKCARACLNSGSFRCLSFDHCPTSVDGAAPCRLHVVHYPNANTRENVQKKSTTCGHYYRKFSTEFNKNPQRRTVGSTIPPLTNLTLEECSKSCVEIAEGVCYGFDFCQGNTILSTSCTLLNKEVSTYKTVEHKMCTNFIKIEPQASPLPFSNSYAGGIGFLCFLIGALVGAAVIFGIAYLRVNRR